MGLAREKEGYFTGKNAPWARDWECAEVGVVVKARVLAAMPLFPPHNHIRNIETMHNS